MSEENVVVIEEPQVEEAVEYDTEGLTDVELASAKELGIITEDKDVKKEDEGKEEESPAKEEKEEEKAVDPDNFEDMEAEYTKDEQTFHKKFTPNAKALYFKLKRNKQLRQEAQEEAKSNAKDRDFLATKEKAYLKQLGEIDSLLDRIDSGDETITTAEIRKVVAFKKEQAEKEEVKEPEVSTEKQQQYVAEKIKNTEGLGRSTHPDFDRYIELAEEVIAQDKDIATLITKAFYDPEVDEAQLVEKIKKYAKLHPDFDKNTEEKVEKNEKIDRMVANANKKKTSAAISGGSGRREVGYDDLTLEDVARMSRKDYDKLPDEVRERILSK